MKKIFLDTLQIENFLSIVGPLTWNFREGLILLTGQNRDTSSSNGSGKSALLDALFWSLFGETLRELPSARKLGHFYHSEDPTIVTLSFRIQQKEESFQSYKIVRVSNPGSLYLECNGTDISESSISKTNEKIIRLIQLCPETFKNCILLSAGNTIPFLSQKKVLRRKFIEGIFGLHILDTMFQLIKEQVLEHKKEQKTLEQTYAQIVKSLEQSQIRLEQHVLHVTSSLQQLDSHVTQASQRLKEIEQELQQIPLFTEENQQQVQQVYDKLFSTHKTLLSLIQETEADQKITLMKIQELQSQMQNRICATCQRPFSEQHFKSLEQQIQEQQQLLENIQKRRKETEKKLEKIQPKLEQVQTYQNQKMLKQKQLKIKKIELEKEQKMIQSNLQIHKERIVADKLFIVQLKTDVAEWKAKALQTEQEIQNITSQIVLETQAQEILRDESGVKTFLMKKIIETLNDRLAINLHLLGLPYKIFFDEFFEETTLDVRGGKTSYSSLSSGERKRADLAILFTFQEILMLQSGLFWNCVFYDELLDNALDEEGIKASVRALRQRYENYHQSVYLVTHSARVDQSLFDEVKCIVKEKGVSHWIEEEEKRQ